MILANVNIGSGASSGDGDPLRSAFNIINQNFTKIQSNVNILSNNVVSGTVTTVAGRSGNVVLTTLDIVGFDNFNYANIAYVNSAIDAASVLTTGNIAFSNYTLYTPANAPIIISPGFTSNGYASINVADDVNSGNIGIVINNSNGNVRISANNHNFTFNLSGMLTYPDGSNQNTAYRVVTAPLSSIGNIGDVAGMVAFSNVHLYYCALSYNGGDIWQRVLWNGGTW